MEKKEEEIDSNDSNEEEEFPLYKRKHKLDLTIEEIKNKYEIYLNCKLKYPKSQFCFFYFKGTCLLGDKCQFCHGYKEFSMDRFFTFLQDKNAVEKSSQKFYQKFYFNQIIPKEQYTYDNLLEFQEQHSELFHKKYTFTELKKSRKKRLIIRKLLTKDIIEKFLVELFNKYNCIKLEDLNYYIYNVGYPQSIKLLLKNTKICFSKSYKDKNKNILYFIKGLTKEEMLNIFAKKIIEYTKNGKYEDFFPINYSYISKIIFTTTQYFEPNITTFNKIYNINEKDFMDILFDKLINECNKGNFDLIKNKTKKDLIKENIKYKINIEEIYKKHFELNKTNFCFFIVDKILEKIHENLDNNTKLSIFDSEINFNLFKDGNIFFFNNEGGLNVLNYNKFKSFNIDEFYNNNFYFMDCFKEISIENKIENLNINSSNDNVIIDNNIKLDENNNIYNIKNTTIYFINDKNSLKYFENKSKSFEILSIDIEGDFTLNNIRINLIQICDDTNLNNDIYVIDFNTFKTNEKEKDIFIQLSKLLKNIFENKNIKKIFFDGRSDLLSLHKELNICVKSYIDLSTLYNAVNSYKEMYQFKILNDKKDIKTFKNCLNICKTNYYFKGLNTVLKEYHSKHCFNPLKDKYHKLFKQKPFEYWAKRPIIQEFLLYSALDVKYEYDSYNNLKNELKKILIKFYEVNDISENNIDLIILLISYGNHFAACNNYINIVNKIK